MCSLLVYNEPVGKQGLDPALDWTGLFFFFHVFPFLVRVGGGGRVGMGVHFYFRFGIIAPRTEIVNF